MRSPFPGMDPYLEDPEDWHPFHTMMVAELARHCSPLLPDDYYVAVESRTYVVTSQNREEVQIPDAIVAGRRLEPRARTGGTAVFDIAGVEVTVPSPETLHQRYLEIRRGRERERVVTAIEVLSPSNKRPGLGRDDYAQKRGRVLSSRTNLVEIDLLRTGPRRGALGAPEGADYSVLISRAHQRPSGQFLPIDLRDPLPDFPLPLEPEDEEPVVKLSAILASVYEIGRYSLQVDYREDPVPPLSPEDEGWADGLLRDAGLR